MFFRRSNGPMISLLDRFVASCVVQSLIAATFAKSSVTRMNYIQTAVPK
jgi:hypothetical protein